MLKVLAVLLFVSAAASADDSIGLYVKAVLENFRAEMPKGIPQLGIPVLEPFKADNIEEHFKEGVADIQLKINDLLVSKLSTFDIRHATGNMENLLVHLKVYFPTVHANGHYDLNGKILIFPLYGKGPARITVNNLNVDLKASIKMASLDKIQLDDFNVDAHFSDFNIRLEGLVGGGNLGDVINAVINTMGKGLFDKHKGKMMGMVNNVAKKAINAELDKVSLKDILGGVLPFKKQPRQLA